MMMIFLNALFLLLASQSLAVPTEKQNSSTPAGVLQLPLFIVPSTPTPNKTDDRALTGRQVSSEVNNFSQLQDAWGFLGTVIEIGTPPQRVILEPDTGSKLLWIPSLQPGQKRAGIESTFFDTSSSSSLQDLGISRVYKYKSKEKLEAKGYQDDISIEGQPVGRMIVGIVDLSSPNNKVERPIGVLPLKPSGDLFLPQKLLDQNIVRSRAFGLGAREHGRGLLTFGGYDASKFSGPLEKLAMVPGSTNQDIVIIDSQSNQGDPVDILVDSGSPGWILPTSLLQDFTTKTGATVQGNLLSLGCHVVNSGAAFDFHITNNVIVSIPLLDFVYDRQNYGRTCRLAIEFGKPPIHFTMIGRHFLRRAYMVHDYDAKFMYVARGADCGSNTVAIDGTMPDNVIGNCAHEYPLPDQPAPVVPGVI